MHDILFQIVISCVAEVQNTLKTDLANMMSSVRDVCDSVLRQIPKVGTTPNPEYRKILCVGLACLDNIYVVKTFPVEDTDVRYDASDV